MIDNRTALAWWRSLPREAQEKVAASVKPCWTFDMFTQSTAAIRNGYSLGSHVLQTWLRQQAAGMGLSQASIDRCIAVYRESNDAAAAMQEANAILVRREQLKVQAVQRAKAWCECASRNNKTEQTCVCN